MSVISLSSEDEDDCVIVDSDEEEVYQHQIFIVESNTKDDVNGDDQLVVLPESSNCIEAEESYANKKSFSKTDGADNALKLLASKLAAVIENEKQVEDKILREHRENVMSNIEKTIFDVSKGFFSDYSSLKTNHTKKRVWKRISKVCNETKFKKWNSRSDLNTKLDLCSSTDSRLMATQNVKSLNVNRDQNICTTKAVSESNQNASKTTTYGNKLKFTYDKLGAVYSVSVVSTTKTNETECEINGKSSNYPNETASGLNQANKMSKKDMSERQNTEQNQKHCLSEYQNCGKNKKQSSVKLDNSQIPFSDIKDLKNTFNKHYSSVFDQNADYVCINMGFSLMTSLKETTKLKALMNSVHKYPTEETNNQNSPIGSGFPLEKNELKTSIQICNDTIERLKVRFIEDFSKIHNIINENVIDTQLKVVLLTAWFMKMFLSITTGSFELEDLLHEAKTKTLHLLKADILKWPLITKVFIKEESLFENDCLLVLDLIKDCLKGQSEQNTLIKEDCKEKKYDKKIHLESDSDQNQILPVAISKEFSCSKTAEDSTTEPENTLISKLPEELQKLAKKKNIEVSITTSNLSESKSVKPNTSLQTVSTHSNLEKTEKTMNNGTRAHFSNHLKSFCHSTSREPLQIISLSGHPNNGIYTPESEKILSHKLSEAGIKSVVKESNTCLISDSGGNKLMPPCVSDENGSFKGALHTSSKRKVVDDSCYRSKYAKHFSKSESSPNFTDHSSHFYKNDHLLQNGVLSSQDSELFIPCDQKNPTGNKAVFNETSRPSIQSNLYFGANLDMLVQNSDTTVNNTINVQQGFNYYQCYSPSKKSFHGLPLESSPYNTQYENSNQACFQELSIASTNSKTTSNCQYLHCSQEGFMNTNSSQINLANQQFSSQNIGGSKTSVSHLLNIEAQGYSVCSMVNNPGITIYNITNFGDRNTLKQPDVQLYPT